MSKNPHKKLKNTVSRNIGEKSLVLEVVYYSDTYILSEADLTSRNKEDRKVIDFGKSKQKNQTEKH